MLKITIHDSAKECRFRLDGALAGEQVREFENCWRTAASTTVGRDTTVELRVESADGAGESLLQAMHGEGVRLRGLTPAGRHLATRITGVEDTGPLPEFVRSRSVRLQGMVPRIVLLILLLLASAPATGPVW